MPHVSRTSHASHASYRHAAPTAPCYGLSHAVPHRTASARAATHRFPQNDDTLSDSLVNVRHASASCELPTHAVSRRHYTASARSPASAWPAAFALMLVANLALPAASSVPKIATRREPSTQESELAHPVIAPENPMTHELFQDVLIKPLAHTEVKTDYTSHDVLRSIGGGSAPFQHLSESAADIYSLLTGREVNPSTRAGLSKGGQMMDVATGLFPEVAVLRVPSEIADVVADDLEGKPLSAEQVVSILQNTDVRALSRPLGTPLHHMPEGKAGKAPGPMRHAERTHVDGLDGPEKKISAGGRETAIDSDTGNTDDIDDIDTKAHIPLALPEEMPMSPLVLSIEGEREHLQGYEQDIAHDRLPAGAPTRLVLVDGRRYLRGEAGFYLASRGQSGDHWLIDAPRKDRAQVPVTYDPATRQWQAFEPLRLCGGGCGTSRGTTPDSIALNRHDVDAVLSHLHDDEAQNAILAAYSDVSRMKLRRTNRADLRAFRDYSIVRNRERIQSTIEKTQVDASLFEQQRLAALVTASHYRMNPGTEAFCQENAEILFHFLLENGIHGDCIRMITIQPKARAPHALVLYTESDEIIDALTLATPEIYDGARGDGITGDNFAGLVMSARDDTVLLDPWSRVKAVGFSAARDPEEVMRVLDEAFVDIGHRSGKPYTVALTRPLGPRRTSVNSQGSAGTVSGASGSSRSSGSTQVLGSSSSLDEADAPRPVPFDGHEPVSGA